MDAVLQQDRTVQAQPFQLCGEQAKGRNRWQCYPILDGYQLRLTVDFEISSWIDLVNVQILVNALGTNIVFQTDARSDFFPSGASDDHAHRLFSATSRRLIERH